MNKKKILIIESDQEVKRNIETVLKCEGHKVDSTQTGPEGIKRLEANRYDICLIEAEGPVDLNFDLIDDVRAVAPETRLIVITDPFVISAFIKATNGRPLSFIVDQNDPDHVKTVVKQTIDASEREQRSRQAIEALREDVRKEKQQIEQQLIHTDRLSTMGELFSSLAHELNNPLTVVSGFAEVMLREPPGNIDRESLNTIFVEAMRCRRLVNSMLSFIRRSEPKCEIIDVNKLIDEILELIGRPLTLDNISVIKYYDSEIPPIHADTFQFQQIFLNIIRNAHHAMASSPGTRELTIVTESLQGEIVIYFSNTGPTIPEEMLERIFEPFFTTKREGMGTGLGLSLSRQLVSQYGGSITASSPDDGGVRFTLRCPAAHTRHDSPPDPSPPAQKKIVGKKILVIDDETALCKLYQRMLTKLGYEVEVAFDGEKAIQHIEQGSYDLIISDLRMPGLNGEMIYDHLLTSSPEAARHLIFSTGAPLVEETNQFLAKSNLPVIRKPFSMEELDEIIQARLLFLTLE